MSVFLPVNCREQILAGRQHPNNPLSCISSQPRSMARVQGPLVLGGGGGELEHSDN
jgi:hypothetical protein